MSQDRIGHPNPEQESTPATLEQAVANARTNQTELSEMGEKLQTALLDHGVDTDTILTEIDEDANPLDHILTYLDPQQRAEIEPLALNYLEQEAQQNTLEDTANKLGQIEVGEKLQGITEKTDWDSFLEAHLTHALDRDVKELLEYCTDPKFRKADYSTSEYVLEQLSFYEPLLKEHELRAGAEPNPPFNEVISGDLQGGLNEHERLTKKALLLANASRSLAGEQAFAPAGNLERIKDLAANCGLTKDSSSQTPAALAFAVEKLAVKACQSIDAKDQKLLTDTPRFEAPLILGENLTDWRANLAESTGIIDFPSWLNEEFDRYPGWLTEGVGVIKVVPDIEQEGQKQHLITTGRWNQDNPDEQHKLTLALNTRLRQFKKRVEYLVEDKGMTIEEATPKVQSYLQNKIRGTLRHELAHKAHINDIPLPLLRDWVLAVEAEPGAAITEYVERVQKDPDAEESTRLREDFADSLQVYLGSPKGARELARVSSRRFNVIDNLFPKTAQSHAARISQSRIQHA